MTLQNRGYPTLEVAQKIWLAGYDYRCATTPYTERDEYLFHSKGVARAAQTIAAHTFDMDAQKSYILGLLHDYGRKYDERATGKFHSRSGYEELNAMGYPLAARICLTHTFPRRDFKDEDYLSYPPEWLDWARKELNGVVYDDYDRLIQLCDMFFEGLQMVDFESRFTGIVRRYNLPRRLLDVLMENALRLRGYFEDKTGQDIYQLLNIRAL
ncbi:MAG: HD domain-containing protein [Proteobacteria bacterium]|nr:HD domain-containing protein [Pseudomonadota bacterium]